MTNEKLSPRRAQRLRLFNAYRGRGRRNSNLFLIYSVKTDHDWIISGDRCFVHWVYYLEANPSVKTFVFTSEFEFDTPRAWAVDVLLTNGERETHYVGRDSRNPHTTYEQHENPSNNDVISRQCRIFSDADLRPVVNVGLRWLKPIGFAAALRDYEYPQQTLALLAYFHQHGKGEIGKALAEPGLCEGDAAQTLGLIARLAILGHINLDLTSNSFGYRTPWLVPEGG